MHSGVRVKIRYFIENALVRLTVMALSPLPFAAISWIARRFGDLAYLIMSKRRTVALGNLERAFGNSLSPERKEHLARKAFQHTALSIVELYFVRKLAREAHKRFTFHGFEYHEEAFAKGRGVILVISHLGSWEYLSFLPYLKGTPSCVVVKSIKNPLLDRQIDSLRRVMKVDPVAKKSSSKKILTELKANHLAAILIDQWAGPEGLWTTFFGHPTSTTSIPARLAKKTGAVLLPAACIRTGDWKYEIRFEKPVDVAPGDAWERETTEALNRLLEEAILRTPDQWTWGHKRWKPRPASLREA